MNTMEEMNKPVQERYTKLQAFWRLSRVIRHAVTITICDNKTIKVNVEAVMPRFSRQVYVD